MELDIIKTNTTWNDAAGSINNNFEKLRLSVEEGGGSSVTVDTEVSDTSTNPIANKSIKKYVDDELVRMEGYAEEVANEAEASAKQYTDEKISEIGGGGASIPVVSSEEELESLSQNKGDLAVILSDDEVKSGNVRCLELPTISMAAVQALDFSECASVQGIAINTEVDVLPCPALAGDNIQFMIVPRAMTDPQTTTYLGFYLSGELDAEGYLRGALQVSLIENGSASYVAQLAQYDETTGKMVADLTSVQELNGLIALIEDPVFVSLTEMATAGGEELKDTLAFFECIASVTSFGTKSIRIKNDDGYSRLDSDVVRVIPKDAVPDISKLEMPNGSQVRVYCPEETVYDTDPKDFKCCITDPSFNPANATVVNKLEFLRACDTTISSDSNPLPPYIVLCDINGEKKVWIRWIAGESAPYKAMYSEDEWATTVILLENGVWNEENIEALNAIIASGVNILLELGKNNENGAGDDVNVYNPKTGIMTYLEDYGEDGILSEDELASITLLVTMLFGAYFVIYANERIIPEHVESYSRLKNKWVKDEVEVETEWSESSATSHKPIASSLFFELMRDYDDEIRKELNAKQPTLVSGENIATVNGQSLLEGGNIVIEGGGSDITVDDALSDTSTNPVQNAAITAELNKKVNAETGKGLSTNDYTTTDKDKLSGIESGAQKNPTFATINGQRIDQGGEIVVEGGSSEKEVYRLNFGADTSDTIAENKAAYDAFKSGVPATFYIHLEANARYEVTYIWAGDDYAIFYSYNQIQRSSEIEGEIRDTIETELFAVSMESNGNVTNSWSDIVNTALDASDVLELISNSASAVAAEIAKKQDILVDGESIKTVNGVSLLGSGNIQLGGAVIFDATCANDIYNLPELQTTTDVQTIIDAIATSQPIYVQFAVNMIPAAEAYLANGFPHLLLQTVDAEEGKARMVHIYALEDIWTWERFDMELGGAAGTFVKSVNGVAPDDNGNVQIDVTIDGEVVDTTLSTLVGSGSTFTLEELIG